MVSDKGDCLDEKAKVHKDEPLVDMSVRHELPLASCHQKSGQASEHLHPMHLVASHSAGAGGEHAETEPLSAFQGQFKKVLETMRNEGHHWDVMPWLQNISEERKCYSQAEEMGRALRTWIDKTPGMKGNFSVMEGTINAGKGANPIDFYSGNGEHNFVVVTDLRSGTKYYGDPWDGRNFSKNPHESVRNYKGQEILVHDF